MKKTYIVPAVQQKNINASQLICLSLGQGEADTSEVLSKEREDDNDPTSIW